MPDSLLRASDMDFVNAPDTPATAIIACGHLPGGALASGALASRPPCYQALGPWGEPDAGLPWFRIGQAEGADDPGAPAPWPPAADGLAGILRRRRWLLLVVGGDHDSLSLALALATYARGRGVRVLALLVARPGQPFLARNALQRCVDRISECPAGQDPLLVAQVLASRLHGQDPAGAAGPDPRAPD